MLAAVQSGGTVGQSPTLPDGIPGSDLLEPQPDGSYTLKVHPAFAEERPAAYVTSEIWSGYIDSVWLEPIYAQLASAGPPPQPLVDGGTGKQAPRIVDVGPDTTFYSPFWQVNAAVVGEVAADHFRSSHALLDAGVPIVPLGESTGPLAPREIAATPPGGHLVEPTWGTALDDIVTSDVWLEDEGKSELVGLLNFGPNLIRLDAIPGRGAIVEALPLFLFVSTAGGTPSALVAEPRVAGVGPLGSGVPADVGVGPKHGWPQPRFGGFWRVTTATLPPAGGPFHADGHPTAAAAATGAGIDVKEYEGRVALDAACFDDAAHFPGGCTWLDSQARVESLLGAGALAPTELTATCPFVFYDKTPVER
jgi:hypothetical protein